MAKGRKAKGSINNDIEAYRHRLTSAKMLCLSDLPLMTYQSGDKGSVRSEIKRLGPGPAPNNIIKDPYVLEFLDIKRKTKNILKQILSRD
ncbi:hypothetical protein BROC_02369 [Candidatus Brocadiaceae bacterium]|nr:hypothetical protein BROC_02369 [Candidatus Brocadiaceae bacterium]